MAVQNVLVGAFNRGLLSPLALSRVDLTSRVPWSAEVQTNFMPRTLGSMMLRPGLQYTGATHNNEQSKTLPFIFSMSDTSELEMTDEVMRVWTDDELLTRPDIHVDTIPNGDFNGSLTSWTDLDESGATSQWSNGSAYGLTTGNYMELLGTGFTSAIRRATVSSISTLGTLHAMRIVVARGPVTVRVTDAAIPDNDIISPVVLQTGVHSITFTPVTGSVYIYLQSSSTYRTFVQSIQFEAAGVFQMPTPWDTAQLQYLRWTQSADVMFVAANNIQQRRVERRNNDSWSIVTYQSDDGPFRNANTSNVTIAPSALSGDVTLTASAATFNSGMVGGLFKITSIGQVVQASFNGANQFGNSIRVTGTSTARSFTYSITGTFTATVTMQRSVGDDVSWVDFTSFVAPASGTISDGLDNQIVYYRLCIKTGNYTSGTAATTLTYANGGLTGIARVTYFTSSTVVGAAVLTPFGSTTGSSDWAEGSWSDYRGWPGAVSLYEGRLWWAGKAYNYGSVSDAYDSFDTTIEGDSAAIIRSIGEGPVDTISWLMPLQRLVIGGEGAEYSARSTSFDEPLTPTNYNVKSPSTQGSYNVAPVKIDTYGVFIQKSGQRVMAVSYNPAADDFTTADITLFCPQVGQEGLFALAAQRMPDTRIHAVRGDGLCGVMVTDPLENVRAWVLVESPGASGEIEDVWVLPGVESPEDRVYYTVKRTIDGQTVRYREKWALEEDCVGGTLNLQADSFISGTQASSTTISGLDHLEGEEVIVWADGVDLSPGFGDDQVTYTVTAGAITLDVAVTQYVVGLPYKARYKSTKLAYAAQFGTAINQKKKIGEIGIVAANMHARGLQYGTDFDNMDDLPETEAEGEVDENHIYESYDYTPFTINGTWDTDERLCLQATAPRPVTLLSVMMEIKTNERKSG